MSQNNIQYSISNPTKSESNLQTFLDTNQYALQSIRRYELIFGEGYISTGGQDTTTELVSKLNLCSGNHVLDIGCGIGGGDIYMAQTYDVSVIGVDLSQNMISMAMEKIKSLKKQDLRINFEISDIMTREFPMESFDAIYCRDTILHIENKERLFKRCLEWLKPGGQILITDYCCGENDPSNAFVKYVKNRGYHLLSPNSYGQLLKLCGFQDVIVEDRTSQFIEILQTEMDRVVKQKDNFIKETSEQDFDDILTGWKEKIIRCKDGDQKWGMFHGFKAE